MSAPLVRAAQLREFNRHDEAIALLSTALAGDPENPWIYQELALNRNEIAGQREQALEDIGRAIAQEPDESTFYTIQAHILCKLDRNKEALASAQKATALDPEDPNTWAAKALALCGLSKWSEGEHAARKALALDPDEPNASNILAHALRLQNRLDESEAESLRRLERDPENAWSFSTAGWTALQRGESKQAQEKFREALRLDPELEHARIGLREAFKARSFLYRLFLSWAFFMERHSEKNQWLIIIGLYLGYRFGVALLGSIHPIIAVPVIFLYLFFAFGGWLASGIGHFLLLKDPVARLSLNRGETLDGLVVGGLFFGGLLIAALAITPIIPVPVAFLGLAVMGAAVPASRVFGDSSSLGRVVFSAITIAVVSFALTAVLFHTNPSGVPKHFHPTGSALLGYSLIGVIGTTWLGLIPALRDERPS